MFVIGELPVGHPQPPLLEVPLADSLSSLGSFLHLPMETWWARDNIMATALLNVIGTYDCVNILLCLHVGALITLKSITKTPLHGCWMSCSAWIIIPIKNIIVWSTIYNGFMRIILLIWVRSYIKFSNMMFPFPCFKRVSNMLNGFGVLNICPFDGVGSVWCVTNIWP